MAPVRLKLPLPLSVDAAVAMFHDPDYYSLVANLEGSQTQSLEVRPHGIEWKRLRALGPLTVVIAETHQWVGAAEATLECRAASGPAVGLITAKFSLVTQAAHACELHVTGDYELTAPPLLRALFGNASKVLTESLKLRQHAAHTWVSQR